MLGLGKCRRQMVPGVPRCRRCSCEVMNVSLTVLENTADGISCIRVHGREIAIGSAGLRWLPVLHRAKVPVIETSILYNAVSARHMKKGSATSHLGFDIEGIAAREKVFLC